MLTPYSETNRWFKDSTTSSTADIWQTEHHSTDSKYKNLRFLHQARLSSGQTWNQMEVSGILNYLGMWLLKGDSGAVDEWWVSEQVGGGGGKSVTAAGLVVQDSWEADVNCVLQRLQLRLLSPNKITHTSRFQNPFPPSIHMRNVLKH